MNVAEACFSTVHDFPGGGAEKLGPLLGKRGTSLSAEVRLRSAEEIAADVASGRSVPKFGLLDAMRAMQARGDLRILNAMAAELGCMAVRLPQLEGDEAPAAADVAAVAQEFSKLMGRVVESLDDGKVKDNELQEVERQAGLLVANTQRLLASLFRMNAELRATAPGAAS